MKFFPKLFLRCQFEIVEVDGEVSAVSVGGDSNDYNGVILLKNESTRFMFEKLQEGITLLELMKACMEKYNESSVEEVAPQVIAFLDQLKEQELLLADTQNGIKIED